MSLSYETGNDSWGTLVGEAVFAVGADKRYIVAKQHPAEDKTITNYFIVDRGQKPFARDSTAVAGPFTEKQFGQKVTELKLPGFSKTIDILN